MSSSESFFHNFRYNINSSSGSVDKATCTASELRRPGMAGEMMVISSGMWDESDTAQIQVTGSDLPRSQSPSSRVVGHCHVEAEERPYLHDSSAAMDISEGVGCIGDTVGNNIQSIGDDTAKDAACIPVGKNEDITGSSNRDSSIIIIDQEATAVVAPSKLTTTKHRKVTERPPAAERTSRPGKRTKIESEFDKLTTLEQTMFIRSKQQQQTLLKSSATGLSTRPIDSGSSLELRQRELSELRRELSSVLSIGAEVRSRESKLKRAISRLQKEVASCLEPVQCAKEPAEPVSEPLAQLFPLPKHGSGDAQQRCFKAGGHHQKKTSSMMWTLAAGHPSDEMMLPLLLASFNTTAVVSDHRCCEDDIVRGCQLSLGGSNTNDCVGAPGIQVEYSSSSLVDDGHTTSQQHPPKKNADDVEVMIDDCCQAGEEAEVDALCDGDQATSSIVVELVTIKSHSSNTSTSTSSIIFSSSPARGGAVQMIDLTGDTPLPTVRHGGRNEAAVAAGTENTIIYLSVA